MQYKPHTAVSVETAPDYILEEPPSYIKVESHSVFSRQESVWRTVLEVW